VAPRLPLRRPALVALPLVALPSNVSAQDDVPELRSYRHMAVGNVSFLTGLRPALHGGYLAQMSLAKSRTTTDEFGVPTVHPPRWYAHFLGAAGLSFDTDGQGAVGPAGLGQLGLLRRLDSEGPLTISRVGLAAQGSLAPTGYGVVSRWGLLHGNAAVSVGWMRLPDAGGDRLVVNIDLLRCILQDLGLVQRCLIP
jgi:hypothetical protein